MLNLHQLFRPELFKGGKRGSTDSNKNKLTMEDLNVKKRTIGFKKKGRAKGGTRLDVRKRKVSLQLLH